MTKKLLELKVFGLGMVANNKLMMQFPHRDDVEVSCHISGNLKGLSLMIHKIINNKLHHEQIHMPFGCMLTLSDDVVHGGCLDNCGSFRFHFALKQLNKRAQEKSHHDDKTILQRVSRC